MLFEFYGITHNGYNEGTDDPYFPAMMLMTAYGIITATQTFKVFRDFKDPKFERRLFVSLHIVRSILITASLILLLCRDRHQV